MRGSWKQGCWGVVFGFALSNIGFGSWDEVHKMFTFADLRLFLAFCLAVAIMAVGWRLIAKWTGASWNPRKIHQGTLVGGVLFGIGWALCGACPSIALVQLGQAQLGALFTLAGILLGNYVYAVVHERYLHWSTRSCADD
jgi:uncharacterized membrane protein YedE/YeeE